MRITVWHLTHSFPINSHTNYSHLDCNPPSVTGRPQSVRIGNRTSASIITGIHQGCVLSPILYTLLTHNCVASHNDNIILKFTDDTTVIGRITGDDEAAYRREVAGLVAWCEDNSLSLNTNKTKEMIVERRKEKRPHQPLSIRELGWRG